MQKFLQGMANPDRGSLLSSIIESYSFCAPSNGHLLNSSVQQNVFPHVEDYLIVVQSLVQVFFKQLETSKSMGRRVKSLGFSVALGAPF